MGGPGAQQTAPMCSLHNTDFSPRGSVQNCSSSGTKMNTPDISGSRLLPNT
jgi:hypothetical protein